MATVQQVQQAISRYWGVVMSAATQHLTTANLWSAIRDAAAQAGLPSPGVSASAISVIRGQAGKIVRATEQLAAAQPELQLTSAMISQAPWSRPLSEQNTVPMYQVRFEQVIATPEGQQTIWRTSMVQGELPATVGGVQDMVAQDASNMAAEYEVDMVGIGQISILAV